MNVKKNLNKYDWIIQVVVSEPFKKFQIFNTYNIKLEIVDINRNFQQLEKKQLKWRGVVL